MTRSDILVPTTLLSDKLSLVTHHHLLMRVPVKLDLDNWNFGSWEFLFEELCASYEVDKYLCSLINKTSASSLAPLTPEETKVDKIKIDSIVNILTSLDTHVNKEDVFHYALEGLPDTYNQVCGYMHWKDTFPDLKAVRSLLIAEKMILKSKVVSLPVDSSSPMVLVAETSTNSRSSTSQGKSWKPCFNFAKGTCRFGDSCRYVHDANARVSNANSGFNKGCGTSKNTTNDLLTNLLAQLGHLGMNVAMSNNGTNVTLPTHATITPTVTGPNIASNVPTVPHAFYTSPGTSLGPNSTPPHGFPPLAQAHIPYYGYTTSSTPAHLTPPTAGSVHTTMGLVLSSGAVNTSRQATLLPQAFTIGTLYDPTTGAWNMDTGASSHLNNSITSLSTILNSCMYSTVSVGNGHSIPVTNTSHSILSTPLKSFRLNNVLITPHIDFMTHRVLLRCDSTGDLYPVMAPSPIPSAFLVSQQTWHQRLGHPGSEVQCRIVSNNVIS
ncbi:ribonuclease H-like domain-containing protein [Tanacetum coccineum]